MTSEPTGLPGARRGAQPGPGSQWEEEKALEGIGEGSEPG